jgi:predicted secreted protein
MTLKIQHSDNVRLTITDGEQDLPIPGVHLVDIEIAHSLLEPRIVGSRWRQVLSGVGITSSNLQFRSWYDNSLGAILLRTVSFSKEARMYTIKLDDSIIKGNFIVTKYKMIAQTNEFTLVLFTLSSDGEVSVMKVN